jgi:hypothetical protein
MTTTFGRALLSATLLSAAALAPPAFAHDYRVGEIVITNPWTRPNAATSPQTGAFMVFKNNGAAPDRLVSADSPVAGKTELHRTQIEGGVARMRLQANGFVLPPGASFELKPGGYHVMLMDLKKPIKAGDKVAITLTFEKAGKVTIEAPAEMRGGHAPKH